MSNGYPANNVYIGARYVPKIVGEWDSTKETAYEPLIIVTYQGNSYTSRQYVPAGIDINNTEYWVLTGNFNGQIESFRLALEAMNSRIDANTKRVGEKFDNNRGQYVTVKMNKLFDAPAELVDKVNQGSVFYNNQFYIFNHASDDAPAFIAVLSENGKLEKNMPLTIPSISQVHGNDMNIYNNRIYLTSNVSGSANKVFVFNLDGSYIKTIEMPYAGYSFNISSDGQYAVEGISDSGELEIFEKNEKGYAPTTRASIPPTRSIKQGVYLYDDLIFALYSGDGQDPYNSIAIADRAGNFRGWIILEGFENVEFEGITVVGSTIYITDVYGNAYTAPLENVETTSVSTKITNYLPHPVTVFNSNYHPYTLTENGYMINSFNSRLNINATAASLLISARIAKISSSHFSLTETGDLSLYFRDYYGDKVIEMFVTYTPQGTTYNLNGFYWTVETYANGVMTEKKNGKTIESLLSLVPAIDSKKCYLSITVTSGTNKDASNIVL